MSNVDAISLQIETISEMVASASETIRYLIGSIDPSTNNDEKEEKSDLASKLKGHAISPKKFVIEIQ
jgi:hypothetical protein